VQCDCLSRRCGGLKGVMVSRSTWFRHKAADLLASRSGISDNETKDDNDMEEDPLYVPADDIDPELLADLEASGLFDEEADEVRT
jgi:hypothetical protein